LNGHPYPSTFIVYCYQRTEEAIFERLRGRGESPEDTAATIWHTTTLLDKLLKS